MPYYIEKENPACNVGEWATTKEDGEVMGCHPTKKGAIDQAVAIALADDSEFVGERALGASLNKGEFVSWDGNPRGFGEIIDIVMAGAVAVPGTGVEITGTFLDPAVLIQVYENGQGTEVFVGKPASVLRKEQPVAENPADEPLEPIMDEELNAEDIPEVREVNLTPPAYMRAAARQGLKYHEAGYSGAGLKPSTVREARALAEGNVTADKWVRLRAWIARHLDDLDAPDAKPGSDGYPSAGVVAHLLWGSGPSKSRARQALAYAERIVARLEEENRTLMSVETQDMAKVETRTNSTQFEVREAADGNGMTFTGYAAVFNSPSEPLPFREKIAPGAFRRSLRARNDIKLLWNHETGTVLGSTRAGTLRLEEDSYGLRVSADLPDTQAGRDAAYLIRRGDIDSMSFGFSVPPGGDEWSADGMERTLKSVRLFEASIVAVPAYSATAGHTAVRGLDDVAKRANVDADALADTMLKIETGQTITAEEVDMINSVVGELSEPVEEAAAVEVEESVESDLDMLALKKKKLEQLLKGI